MIYSVWMPAVDGSVAVAVTVSAPHRDAAYEKAVEVTGCPVAGARIEPAGAPAGAYLASRVLGR